MYPKPWKVWSTRWSRAVPSACKSPKQPTEGGLQAVNEIQDHCINERCWSQYIHCICLCSIVDPLQTSITIDDVEFVIDSGKVKENDIDAETNLLTLKEKPVSKAAAAQRRGRAGRSRPGKCFKLFTRSQENGLVPFNKPEILRTPLENVLLHVKSIRREEKADVSTKVF